MSYLEEEEKWWNEVKHLYEKIELTPDGRIPVSGTYVHRGEELYRLIGSENLFKKKLVEVEVLR